MEVKLTLLAPVLEPNPSLLAPITVEWGLSVFKLQLMERVDWEAVNFFLNLHGIQPKCLLSMEGKRLKI